jgi:hypothetical protein
MNPRLAHSLARLYPRRWRDRYGEEFEAFLQSGSGGSLRTSVNVACSALSEHNFPTRRGHMDQHLTFGSVVRRPTAVLPMAMSLSALAVVLVHIAFYGAAREADEGTAAHLWQLLMAGQLPVLAFFAIKWLPRAPRQALYVLAMQAGAALASVAPVFFLNL